MHNTRISLYAMMLAAAGIPLYIHLPRFAAVNLGIGLGAIGTILLLIRLIDLVQDPFLGWLIDRWKGMQLGFALFAAAGLAVGFPMLFGATTETSVAKIVVTLILLFSAYSLGSILLYGRSAMLASKADQIGLLSVAGYREGGMLLGVVLATMAPATFAHFGAVSQGYPAYGLMLACACVVIALFTIPMWQTPADGSIPLSFKALKHTGALRLLLIALTNSLPVAITATLFLFFVEDRLQLSGWAGPLLLLFFLSAGLSVPIWTAVAKKKGGRKTLLIAMPIAIFGFIWAAILSEGDIGPFVLVCIISGVAVGADLVVLPAMFSIVLTEHGLNASTAFGLWSFAGKLGLALAAFLVLPFLEQSGFSPGTSNSETALWRLSFAYAILPCILKIIALRLVWALPKKEVTP